MSILHDKDNLRTIHNHMDNQFPDYKTDVQKYNEELERHIEEFAAAFIKRTNIPPDRAVMIMQIGLPEGIRIWFEERSEKDKLEYRNDQNL